MRGFGGMVTLVLNGDLAGARRFLERCGIFSLAESLGGVESLIEHPAIMTHASIPRRNPRHNSASATGWCVCRWGSRMSKTCALIWRRP